MSGVSRRNHFYCLLRKERIDCIQGLSCLCSSTGYSFHTRPFTQRTFLSFYCSSPTPLSAIGGRSFTNPSPCLAPRPLCFWGTVHNWPLFIWILPRASSPITSPFTNILSIWQCPFLIYFPIKVLSTSTWTTRSSCWWSFHWGPGVSYRVCFLALFPFCWLQSVHNTSELTVIWANCLYYCI